MIKLFAQAVTLTTANTIERDVRTLEAAVNSFIKNPNITPIKTELQQFLSGGTQYLVVLLDYNPTNI